MISEERSNGVFCAIVSAGLAWDWSFWGAVAVAAFWLLVSAMDGMALNTAVHSADNLREHPKMRDSPLIVEAYDEQVSKRRSPAGFVCRACGRR